MTGDEMEKKNQSIIHKVPSLIGFVKFARVYLTVTSALVSRSLDRLRVIILRTRFFSSTQNTFSLVGTDDRFEMTKDNLSVNWLYYFFYLRPTIYAPQKCYQETRKL